MYMVEFRGVALMLVIESHMLGDLSAALPQARPACVVVAGYSHSLAWPFRTRTARLVMSFCVLEQLLDPFELP